MTLSQVVIWSFLRSLILATLALGPAAVISAWLHRRSIRIRRWGLFIVLVPVLMPELLMGFTARVPAAELLRNRWATEVFYGVLLLFRAVAIGSSVQVWMESASVSREAEHSWTLLRPRMSTVRWVIGWLRLRCEGRWRGPLVAWSLMVLLSFQEFETAALMQLSEYPVSWSVSLFDAHATRQPVSDSLRMTILPIICQLIVLVPCLFLLRRGLAAGPRQAGGVLHQNPTEQNKLNDLRSSWRLVKPAWAGFVVSVSAFVWLMASGLIFVFWPLFSSSSELIQSLLSVSQQPGMLAQPVQQILTSAGFSAAAALLAYCVSSLLIESHRTIAAVAILLPGLAGPLVTSLILLALFQLPGLHWMYDTWLPMLLGLTFAVLPKTWLITALLKSRRDDTGIHSAQLLCASDDQGVRMTGRQLLWKLKYAGWCFGGLLICHWCFWDVTTASILRPLRTEPVVTRLYNEMHYGRTETLTLMAALSLILPIATGLFLIMLSRILTTNRQRTQETSNA